MRPNWDEYFLSIAHTASKRSSCTRKQVGCVLVHDRGILSTGYGGSLRGQPHCLDEGCSDGPTNPCTRTVHAEVNAVAFAAKKGTSTAGATAYITLSPCPACFKLFVQAGIVRIVYDELYRIPPDLALAAACGVEMVHLPQAR